jgi:hypothetical protein
MLADFGVECEVSREEGSQVLVKVHVVLHGGLYGDHGLELRVQVARECVGAAVIQ